MKDSFKGLNHSFSISFTAYLLSGMAAFKFLC